MDEKAYGYIDEAMLRPPQILGCERLPFLFTIGMAAFVTVIVFGITLPGIIAGVMLASAGVIVLRRLAVHDPFWFAVMFEAVRYPRHMPDVLTDRTLPRDLAFVGYDDPPSRTTVFLARFAALAIVVLPGAAAWALFGSVPALCTLAVMAAAMTYVIVRFMPRSGQD